MRNINRVLVQCSRTPSSLDIGLDDLNNIWRDVGNTDIHGIYVKWNYIIRRDGTIQYALPDDIVPKAPTRLERDAILVCLVGGVDDGTTTKPFTPAQKDSIETLFYDLDTEYGPLKLQWEVEYELA